MPILGIGNIPIIHNNSEIIIIEVNYIPSLKITLIKPRELTKKGWTINFNFINIDLSYKNYPEIIKAIWN